MILHNLQGRAQEGFTTFGSVYQAGEVPAETKFCLLNETGESVPVQSRITAYWADGSVKWAAHTADAGKLGSRITILPSIEKKEAGGEDSRELAGEGICIQKGEDGCVIDTGKLSLVIPVREKLPADYLARAVKGAKGGNSSLVYPVLKLEEREEKEESSYSRVESYRGVVLEAEFEEEGPLQCVVRFRGIHRRIGGEREAMPFSIRMYLWAGSAQIRFVHTFFYDGDEQRDYLKGMGICFETVLDGEPYMRHVKFGTDRNPFHEAAVLLSSNVPRLPLRDLEEQMEGEIKEYKEGSDEYEAVQNLPIWNRYSLVQDSDSHFAIRKQTRKECCRLACLHGSHAPGTMAAAGRKGGLIFGIRDFWQKYPSGLETDGLNGALTKCTAWFYSPEAPAYDFRHYDTRSYPNTSYEGYEDVGASAYGIGVTSECLVGFTAGVPSDGQMGRFAGQVQKPAVYTGEPAYYHEKRAFGYWSLPSDSTEVMRRLEEEMEKAVHFYKLEAEARNWYGLFDYGDVMHQYDPVRHCWRYDMGGFAWQNTELVPTYWLWLFFIRTGNEEAFILAEAMTRHCSEVDMYHFGPLRGIGTRHNVRHWGCSCKEARIGMAGHQRFYYYLTGDYRLGDVMEDSRDADQSMKNLAHFPQGISEEDNHDAVTCVRSGPDWTSFVSNWMAWYERTLDERYLHKILTGIDDIAQMPFGLASGPEYLYHEKNGHLEYTGEHEESINMHLQVCQGGTQIWLELSLVLEQVPGYGDKFRKLLADYGEFYMLAPEEKKAATRGLIENRPFSQPYFAGALCAFAAKCRGKETLARDVAACLLQALFGKCGLSGFEPQSYTVDAAGKVRWEIPWISTNHASQWSLNTLVALDFIREYFPETTEELQKLL